MSENIIKFYVLANKLKTVIRTGWAEVEISADRLESVAEHIYGCLILAIGFESEYNLNVDLLKVIKMIVVKELEKITLKELTTRDYPTDEERRNQAFVNVTKVTNSLVKKEELLSLLEEYNSRETNEAKFVHQLAKIESDIQAKIYDLEGNFDIDKAKEDAKFYGEELSSKIIPQMKVASDGWILFDRQYYTDEMFKDLSESIQKLNII